MKYKKKRDKSKEIKRDERKERKKKLRGENTETKIQ
jgi:hypothetical protein